MRDELDEGKIKAAWLDEAKEFDTPSADIERVVRSIDAVYQAIQAWMAIYTEAMQAMGQAMAAFTEALNLGAFQRVAKELEEARKETGEAEGAPKPPKYRMLMGGRHCGRSAAYQSMYGLRVPKRNWHPMYGRRPK